jgi:hypothetical protein
LIVPVLHGFFASKKEDNSNQVKIRINEQKETTVRGGEEASSSSLLLLLSEASKVLFFPGTTIPG